MGGCDDLFSLVLKWFGGRASGGAFHVGDARVFKYEHLECAGMDGIMTSQKYAS